MKSEEAQIKGPRLEKPVRITEQVWPEGRVPVVSVFNWAYNHAEFIRESIESILMQETTFPVEIIIHDDASTDGTAEIIREYESKHPQLFRNILQSENQWSQGKSVMEPLFTAPRGEFIALAHGDDYWIAKEKLQKQVEILDQNPKYSMSASMHIEEKFSIHEGAVRILPASRPTKNNIYTIKDVIAAYPFHTSTAMIRNRFVLFPKWMNDVLNGDVCIFILHAAAGPIGFLDIVTSVYRLHKGGVWTETKANQRVRNHFNTFEKVNNHFNGIYSRELRLREYILLLRECESLVRISDKKSAYSIYFDNFSHLIKYVPIRMLVLATEILFGFRIMHISNRLTGVLALRTRLRKLACYIRKK
jgi:glycosyltransferase involved in cell wall biosynthesis